MLTNQDLIFDLECVSYTNIKYSDFGKYTIFQIFAAIYYNRMVTKRCDLTNFVIFGNKG